MNNSRRKFIKKSAAGLAAVYAGGMLPTFTARSYARIKGANEKVRVSVMGVNSRGYAHVQNFSKQDNCEVIHICDVDSRAAMKAVKKVEEISGNKPKPFTDFRRSLDSGETDALVIAAPDHWHTPAAVLALKAGKHVYVEKPCSHNPAEGELLVAAAGKYGKAVQMGNQRRSWPTVMRGIEELKAGIIGKPYFGKSWYANNRPSIGTGKTVPVPDWLNWELWQGPAPRSSYKDNVVHYNWHWFWKWGTGEALNNGTHMIDLLRWGFGVDYPVRVSSNGGRYRYKDDWETPDTQVISLDFGNNITMTWEGRSCNGRPVNGSSVGVIFYGEKGSLFIPGGDKYTVYDLDGKIIKEVSSENKVDPLNTSNPAGGLDGFHIRNFLNNIRNGEKLNADILSGHKSTLLVQLGNIAQRREHSLDIDATDGHILNDPQASRLWQREYEKGWEVSI